MHKNTSRHHLLANYHGGTWNSDNIVRIGNVLHSAFHVVFSHDTIIDQFQHLLDFNKSAMSKDLVKEMTEVLEKYRGVMELKAYRSTCINEERFLESKGLK